MACHYEVTKAQRDERRMIRVRAKELLKSAMKELKDVSSIKPINSLLLKVVA